MTFVANCKIMYKISITITLSLFFFLGCQTNSDNRPYASNQISKTSVYDRVLESKTIRAAYINYPPACMKNTGTGEMSGIFVDVLTKACENLGFKLVWTEEVGWGKQIEGLEANRYDIVGSPVWANVVRGTKTTLSTPVYYSGIGVFVRSNDNRFDNNLAKINDKSVKVGTIDGETSTIIAEQDFPNAEKFSSTDQTDIAQKFLDLTSKKCDVVFAEPYYGYEYLKNNPSTIKNISIESPIRIFGNCYMFRKNEFQMKQMIDIAIQDLINSGYVEKVIKKYEPSPNLFYRPSNPYKSFTK